jgi:hypothetical protein
MMVYIDDGVSLVADRGGGGGGWPVATGASRRAGEERRRRRPRGGWMGRDDARARARSWLVDASAGVFFVFRTHSSVRTERAANAPCLSSLLAAVHIP